MTGELPAGVRLGAFALVLAAAFGAAYGLGAAAGPEPDVEVVTTSAPAEAEPGHAEDHLVPDTESVPAGLAVSQGGYTLRPLTTTAEAGSSRPFAFSVTGPDGAPVSEYDPTHERDLHLIAVRRDLATFQHVHPERSPDGTWTADLDLSESGTYRVLADFAPAGGDPVTLGTDLFVPGELDPEPLPAPAATAAVDGYEVTLSGEPRPGEESELIFTVARDGRPVEDMEPYLGAFGHLVALRAGDLAYLHTHPEDTASAGDRGGPRVAFGTTFPTAGTYRVFLDFQVDGQVRTAPFTVVVPHDSEATGVAGTDVPAQHDTTPHGH